MQDIASYREFALELSVGDRNDPETFAAYGRRLAAIADVIEAWSAFDALCRSDDLPASVLKINAEAAE